MMVFITKSLKILLQSMQIQVFSSSVDSMFLSHLQAHPSLCVSGLDKSTLHADHCDWGIVYPELVDKF